MKAKGPFFTLLSGVAVAAAMLVANANLASANSAAQAPAPAQQAPAGNAATTPNDVPVRGPATDEKPTAPDEKPTAPDSKPANVSWAGTVKGGGATVAIVAKGKQAIAYVCDGKKVEAWLKGSAVDGKLDLKGKNNATLTGTFDNRRAKGTVKVGAKSWTFNVGVAKKPAGLYRAASRVRGAKIVGGWVVLPDGTQVGVLTADGAPQAAPPLNLESGTAIVKGRPVAADAAEPS
jgi:hypothetical protein